ncbi:hypothetical protein BDW42DRAFT_174366 [Aspergillus taichungensis]|uniref:Alpha-1,6-mannosyltransferase Och1 n=1 Tax=Aspergillus taichungensis TaxID=482145 RepID=A0A2J5HN78_9EURO|nr:hypothetical protein BDW42DRAFT_174366 [Aspergillus taichungensis]
MQTGRLLRLAVALSISFVILYSVYLGWPQIPSRFFSSTKPSPGPTNPPERPAWDDASALGDSWHGDPKNRLPNAQTSHYNIPDKVWHSAKTDNITDDQRGWIDSWKTMNPSCRQELLDDPTSEEFVRSHFQELRPDIIEVYEQIPIPILRADLLRYLIVLAEGGIWSDLDVTCEKPLAEWVPEEYKGEKISMVVGIEWDFDWRGPERQVASQFCNWVFMAEPWSRHLMMVVNAVVDKLKQIASSEGIPIGGITLDMLPVDVVDVTGPKIMTIDILKSLAEMLGRPVDDRDFAHTKTPKLVGDVLILPGAAFAAQNNGFPQDQGDVFVSHHYEGSWKEADAAAKERKKQQQEQQQKQQEEQQTPA